MYARRIALLVALTVITGSPALAGELTQIQSSLAADGGPVTLQRYFGCGSGRGYELISAGSPQAVALGIALLQHSDGCFSLSLHSAIAQALLVNPEVVLPYFNTGQLSPQADCIPFIAAEAPKGTAKGLLRRIDIALRGVTRPELQVAKEKCLERVADSRRAASPTDAQPVYRQAAPFDLGHDFGAKDWRAEVTAAVEPRHEIDAYGPPSQSKICFVSAALHKKQCAQFKDLFQSRLSFQGLDRLSVVPLTAAPRATNGLVMEATAWYATGQIHETAIWTYQQRAAAFHLAAAVESAERRIFSSGPLAGCLITANWHVESGETRFGSNHGREITVYQYLDNDGTGGYRKLFEYVTAAKYDPENTRTIDAEIGTIQKKISGFRN